MATISSSFPYDIYRFIHKPIRDLDKSEGKLFVERFLTGPQTVFEDTQDLIQEILTLNDPAKIRAELLDYLKDNFNETVDSASLPITNQVVKEILSIPIYPSISPEDSTRVVDTIKDFFKESA